MKTKTEFSSYGNIYYNVLKNMHCSTYLEKMDRLQIKHEVIKRLTDGFL